MITAKSYFSGAGGMEKCYLCVTKKGEWKWMPKN